MIVQADDAALTRFANSEIHQNVAEANARLSLRFVDGQRIGVAATGRFDLPALEAVAETAGQIARNVEPNAGLHHPARPGARADPRAAPRPTARRRPRRRPSCGPKAPGR